MALMSLPPANQTGLSVVRHPFRTALVYSKDHPSVIKLAKALRVAITVLSAVGFASIILLSPGNPTLIGLIGYLLLGTGFGEATVATLKAGLKMAEGENKTYTLERRLSVINREKQLLLTQLEAQRSSDKPFLLEIGKNRIEQLLGVGGGGVVFSVYHSRFGSRYAMKFPRPDVLDNDAIRRRFEYQETKRLKKIEHVPGIVRIHEAAEISREAYCALMKKIDIPVYDNAGNFIGNVNVETAVPQDIKEIPYILLDLIPGGGRTLKNLMEEDYKDHQGRRMPMPWTDVLLLAFDMAQTMYLFHQEGIIHRDLKPENVFVIEVERPDGSKQRETRIGDFGISTETTPEQGRQTTSGAISGTCGYGPFEQMILGASLDHSADQHAVGVMLYEMLTAGAMPYEGEDANTILKSMLNGPPRRLSTFRKTLGIALPPEFQAAIMKMISKKPNERFPDSLAVIAQLYKIAGKYSIPVNVRNEVALALHRQGVR